MVTFQKVEEYSLVRNLIFGNKCVDSNFIEFMYRVTVRESRGAEFRLFMVNPLLNFNIFIFEIELFMQRLL